MCIYPHQSLPDDATYKGIPHAKTRSTRYMLHYIANSFDLLCCIPFPTACNSRTQLQTVLFFTLSSIIATALFICNNLVCHHDTFWGVKGLCKHQERVRMAPWGVMLDSIPLVSAVHSHFTLLKGVTATSHFYSDYTSKKNISFSIFMTTLLACTSHYLSFLQHLGLLLLLLYLAILQVLPAGAYCCSIGSIYLYIEPTQVWGDLWKLVLS